MGARRERRRHKRKRYCRARPTQGASQSQAAPPDKDFPKQRFEFAGRENWPFGGDPDTAERQVRAFFIHPDEPRGTDKNQNRFPRRLWADWGRATGREGGRGGKRGRESSCGCVRALRMMGGGRNRGAERRGPRLLSPNKRVESGWPRFFMSLPSCFLSTSLPPSRLPSDLTLRCSALIAAKEAIIRKSPSRTSVGVGGWGWCAHHACSLSPLFSPSRAMPDCKRESAANIVNHFLRAMSARPRPFSEMCARNLCR